MSWNETSCNEYLKLCREQAEHCNCNSHCSHAHKSFKAIKYFIISGTKTELYFTWGGFLGGFFWRGSTQKTAGFLGMYPGLWSLNPGL